MKKKLLVFGVFALILGISFSVASFAAISDVNNVKEVHKMATVGCSVCHAEGNLKALNNYGNEYKDAGRNVDAVKAIDTSDSDGDGVTNSEEIKAGTCPGDAASK